MLKHIPRSFTPELLSLMMAMGHGEELLIGDGNFPALSTGGADIPRIFLTAPEITALLKDILYFFPLDDTAEYPAILMESSKESGVYDLYSGVFSEAGLNAHLGTVERFAFYERASKAAGIVISADIIRGGNILLKKGVVRDDR